jgi:thiol-disulfide isomerase/thioredoxin
MITCRPAPKNKEENKMPFPLSAKTAAVTIALLLSLSSMAREPTKLNPGDTPPQLLGTTMEGDEIDAGKFAGKVLVVTFWASWCGPCKKELPILEGIQRAGKDGVKVVAVNIEDREQFKRVAKALTSLTLQITHDYRKLSSDAYGVRGIPHLVLIGRDGKVISVHRGYSEASVDSIIAEINAALAKTDAVNVVAKQE